MADGFTEYLRIHFPATVAIGRNAFSRTAESLSSCNQIIIISIKTSNILD